MPPRTTDVPQPLDERFYDVEGELAHGPVAAAGDMLGRRGTFDRQPYLFSDRYGVGMEYSGLARAGDRGVFRGDAAGREFIAFWLDGDRVVADTNVDVWDATDPIGRRIRDRNPATA